MHIPKWLARMVLFCVYIITTREEYLMSNFAKRNSFSNVNNQSFSFAEAHSLPIEWSVLPFIHLSMHHKHSVLALHRILQNLIRAAKGSSLGNLSREQGSWYIENRCSVNSRPFSPHDIWHRQGREWELEKSGRERPEEKEASQDEGKAWVHAQLSCHKA